MFFGVTIFLSVLSLVTSLSPTPDGLSLVELTIWEAALACFCAAFLVLQNRKWIVPVIAPTLLAGYVLADSILRLSPGGTDH